MRKVKKEKCKICGREISLSNMNKHMRVHKIYIDSAPQKESIYALNHDGLSCQFCGKECKNRNSLCNHERLCKLNPNRQISRDNLKHYRENNITGRPAWNRGLTKETSPIIQKSVDTFYKNEKLGLHKRPEIHYTEKMRLEQSLRMKEIYSKKDPISHVCGRSKKGWYKGYYCQSSWELAFVVYCIDNNIEFMRNTQGFKYTYEGEKHTYYPDFYLIEDNLYIEIKGYYDEKSKAKKEQFKDNLCVLALNEMKPILNYVEETYGKDFIKLYEK